MDLRTYLEDVAEAVYRPAGPVSTVHEITALQYALEAEGRLPVIRIDEPVLSGGGVSAMPVVTNLTASRALTAQALGIADHRIAARAYAERTGAPIPPEVVAPAKAPVQEVVLEGGEADLTALPALVQHVTDPGPYLTAAHATTRDPETGIDNTAIQRCWIKGARLMSWYPYPVSHNARNLRKYWDQGEDCPVAFWIGHHPAVLMGSQAKLAYPASHWEAAGGLIGAPLRLVPSRTHGDAIMVPADAEIVVEGFAPAGRLEADGPFGEYTGYAGPQVPAPVCEVTCITRRKDAIYHDYGSGLADMLVPDNMAMEGKLFGMIRAVAPSLANVYVPASGRRFHAYVQLDEPAPGEARDALMAALAYRRVKTAIAVDTDVDVFTEADMLWALATRVQWRRDGIIVDGLSGSVTDPSWPAGASTTSKMGIDATLPPGSGGVGGGVGGGGAPKPVPPRSRVPDEALARAAKLLEGHDPGDWPRS